jgi:hypothetical protein
MLGQIIDFARNLNNPMDFAINVVNLLLEYEYINKENADIICGNI